MVTVGYITFDDCPMISDICEPYCSHGQHVSGTDGMDYQHRERVASQYAVSATNKTRLKRLVLVHYMLGAAHLARLLPSLIKLLNLEIVMPVSLVTVTAIHVTGHVCHQKVIQDLILSSSGPGFNFPIIVILLV